MDKNIILIGPMGSGKTSVGRRLSCVLNKDFFDTDFEIIARTGVSIEHIFDVEGEAGFRLRETKVLEDLMQLPNIVLATGGGIVTQEANRKLLQRGIVIYLQADIDDLVERCSKSNARPLLNQVTDKRQAVMDILDKREELYQNSADIIIHTTGKKLYAIIKDIKEQLAVYS